MPPRRPLCRREEALCANRSSVLRGLEEAPVSGGGPCASRGGPLCREVPCAERIGGGPVSGGGSCAERRPSVLVGPVLCAERIEGGPCVRKRLIVPNGSTPLC